LVSRGEENNLLSGGEGWGCCGPGDNWIADVEDEGVARYAFVQALEGGLILSWDGPRCL